MTTATATATAGTAGREVTVTHDGATIAAKRKSATWVAVGTGNPYTPSGLLVRFSANEAAIRKTATENGLTVVAIQDPA